MHSAEPIDPRVSAPSRQDLADEAWRAEVASRVNSYRSRRTSGVEVSTPSLDFGPSSAHAFDDSGGGRQVFSPQDYTPSASIGTQVEAPRRPLSTTRNPFDTHYYRRLNSESLAQGTLVPTSVNMGATAAATVPAREPEPEFEAESDADVHEILSDDASSDSALDLEIRPNEEGSAFLERYCVSEPEPEPAPLIEAPVPEPETVGQGNLIVFRRPFAMEPPLVPQPSRDELAEPMNNRPRILEVPEDIMPAVQGNLFPEIRLDSDEQDISGNREPVFAMPLLVAPISVRLMASLTDIAVVLTASLLFAGIAVRSLPDIPHTKPFWMSLCAVSMLLWAVYQHLFLLYAGRTIGMSMKGIRLSTFDGKVPAWKQRVSRARFVFVSFASVALGFFWAFVDEDELCWHDRISQTFPTTE